MYQVNQNPTAKIAIKKSILKHNFINNEKVVYLAHNTDFMLELFNPLSETILCKICFNGKTISSEGLVLYPGQRVFLERFLNENKKLNFQTYEVDKEGIGATKNNGLVEIFFHKERPYYFYNSFTFYPKVSVSSPAFFTSSSTDLTGIISKGEESNQKLQSVNIDFESWAFHSDTIKLLPESKKVYTSEDLSKQKRYCSFCGKKVKYSDNYCSNCGNKI